MLPVNKEVLDNTYYAISKISFFISQIFLVNVKPKKTLYSKSTAVNVFKNTYLDATHVQRIWDMFIDGVLINQRYCGCGRLVTAIAIAIAKIVAKMQLLLAWGPAGNGCRKVTERSMIHGYCLSTRTHEILKQWLS